MHAGEEDHARPWMANIKTCTGLPVEESITMMEDGEIEKARPWVARYIRVVSVLDSRRRRAWVQIASATLSGNSLTQTVHTHRASVHQAAKLVAALLRVATVTAGMAESIGSLPPGSLLTSPADWLSKPGSAPEPYVRLSGGSRAVAAATVAAARGCRAEEVG